MLATSGLKILAEIVPHTFCLVCGMCVGVSDWSMQNFVLIDLLTSYAWSWY